MKLTPRWKRRFRRPMATLLRTVLMAVLAGTVPAAVFGQPATLVRDIYPGTELRRPSPETIRYVRSGSLLFYTAESNSYNRELWRTDGTESGTFPIGDFGPSPEPGGLTDVAGTLFFTVGNEYYSGFTLWKSDGTPAGTVPVRAFQPVEGIDGFTNVDGTLFFFRTAGGTTELWKSDGTDSGTVVIRSGFNIAGFSTPPAAMNGSLYFVADDGVTGAELWKSDGTLAGTIPLGDIRPGPLSSGPSNLTNVAGTLFFTACELTYGCELWKTNGTVPGTVLVRDIATGLASSNLRQFSALGSRLIFVANDGVSGDELWASDGTEAGTILLRDIRAGSGSGQPFLGATTPGFLFFTADDGAIGRELWKTDGTVAGTEMVADITPGPGASFPNGFVALGSTVLFALRDPAHAAELWRSDGTSAGTAFVTNVYFTSSLAELNGFAIFAGSTAGATFDSLFRSDGTPGGTSAFFGFGSPAGSSPTFLSPLGSGLVFLGNDSADLLQFWMTDGSAADTTRLTSFEADEAPSSSSEALSSGGRVFFAAEGHLFVTPGVGSTIDQLTSTPVFPNQLADFGGTLIFQAGQSLWKSDGTVAGTLALAPLPGYSIMVPLAAANSVFFFSLANITQPELWKTDGTPAGTISLKVLTGSVPGLGVAYHGYLYFSVPSGLLGEIWRSDGTVAGTQSVIPRSADSMLVVGDTLYFTSSDYPNGKELWMTDGTASGTHLVADIWAGIGSSEPRDLVSLNGVLYFDADDGIHGRELWRSDGTPGGTQMVADVRPGLESAAVAGLKASGGRLFFSASGFSTGSELWTSDGTAGGTTIVSDIYPGPASSSPDKLTDVAGTLYFVASDPQHGRELWRSDGTSGGTVLVRDVEPSLASSLPGGSVEIAGSLYFGARDPGSGFELWRSDGTPVGTQIVRDIVPGPYPSTAYPLASLGNRLIMFASDSAHGRELWVSDGTGPGTTFLRDVNPGPNSSYPYPATVFGGRVFFGADDGTHGQELWVTDGTPGGTSLFYDLAPGATPGYPDQFVTNGSYLFFRGPKLSGSTLASGVWRTDGTPSGTGFLATIDYQGSLAALGSYVYFIMSDTTSSQIWRTDGSFSGTQPAISVPSVAGGLVRSGSFLYFYTYTGTGTSFTNQLWRTDGTQSGTIQVASGVKVASTLDVNGMLFFAADDGIHGLELWRSDGTAAGTFMPKDIWPGSLGSRPGGFFNVGGKLVFRANDGAHGSELWMSDGTPSGTVMLQDIEPGLVSSRPGLLTSLNYVPYAGLEAIAGTRFFFSATTSSSGCELWSMPMSAVCTPPAAPTVQSTKNPSCGDAVILDAGPGYASYLWSTGETTRTIQVMPAVTTSYTVYVGNAAGCRASQTIVQTVDPAMVPPAPAVSNSGPACVGDTIHLTASSVVGGVYAWTGPNGFTASQQNPTVPNATLAAAGLYSVRVTVNGCVSAPATTTVAVHSVPYRPLARNDGPHCAGQALQLSASSVLNGTYAWTGPNGFTSSQQNPAIPSATAADSGVYSVTVTLDGCVSPPASTSVVVAACQQLPVSLSADASGNGILEPGEMIALAPSWMNTTGSPMSVTGTATAFTGPAGATYSLSDATADYGTVAAGATSSCVSTGDCYAVGVSAPATRPLLHWDAAFSESLSTGDAKSWSLHIGNSFTDVPATLPFYRFVETLLHRGVTGGCGSSAYCPATSVTRAQMAVFLLVSQAGAGYVPPPATGVFADVPIASPFAAWVEELSRRGVTAGCGNGNYCPSADVTRRQMAVFLLVTREGSSYTPPAAIGIFADVPAGNPFAPWIEELFHRGITGGCGNGNYCPADPVSRGQMAVLLTATFGLSLGGP